MARLIIDGSNVMGTRPDGWWRDRTGARIRLSYEVEDAADGLGRALLGDPAAEIVLVHDGPPIEIQLLRVHTRFAGHADDLIAELAGPDDLVVSSDRELVGRIEAAGATALGSGRFLRRLGELG